MGIILGSIFGTLGFILLLVIVGYGYGFYALIVNPRGKWEQKTEEEKTDYDRAMEKAEAELRAFPNTKVEITTHDGLTLRGNFIKAEGCSNITILCLHGYTSRGYREFAMRAQDYLKNGWNVMLPNHRNHAESDGTYVGFATLDRLDGLLWLKEIEKLVPNGDIFITGVSMGGATAMQMASLEIGENVKGIIEDCGYTTCKEEFLWSGKQVVENIPEWTLAPLGIYMKLFAKYGLEDSSSVASCAQAKVPMMFIHGDIDKTVPVSMAKDCYNACTTEKELVIIEGAEHAEAHFHARELYMEKVVGFINKYKSN